MGLARPFTAGERVDMAGTLDTSLQIGLGVFYLLCALMNVGFALYYHRFAQPRKPEVATAWYAVAALFLFHAAAYGIFQVGWVIPKALRDAVDFATGPITYTLLSIVAFGAVLYWRRF